MSPKGKCVCKIQPIRAWIKLSELLAKPVLTNSNPKHTGNDKHSSLQQNVPLNQQSAAVHGAFTTHKAQLSDAMDIFYEPRSNKGALTQLEDTTSHSGVSNNHRQEPSCGDVPVQRSPAQRSPAQRSSPKRSPMNSYGSPLNSRGSPLNPRGSPLNPRGSPLNPRGSPLNPCGSPLNPRGSPLKSHGSPLNPQGSRSDPHRSPAIVRTPPGQRIPHRPGPSPSPSAHSDVYITPPSNRSGAPGDISLVSSSSDTSHVEQNVPLIKNSKQTTV